MNSWAQIPIFAAAGEAVCDQFLKKYPGCVYPAGQRLYHAGEHLSAVYVLLKGAVRIFHCMPDGRELVTKFLKAPALFGDIEAIAGAPALAVVETIDESELATIDASDYLAFLQSSPTSALAHLQQLALAGCVVARNERQLFMPLNARVANLLLSYTDMFGEMRDGAIVLRYRLTQQQLADSLATTRRSVATILAAWKKKGLVTREDDSYVIHDGKALEEFAAPIRHGLCFDLQTEPTSLTVSESVTFATLVVKQGNADLIGRQFDVGHEAQIGRSAGCAICLRERNIAPYHCRIFRSSGAGRFFVEALTPVHATFVNKSPIRRAVLQDGDRIQVGAIVFELKLAAIAM